MNTTQRFKFHFLDGKFFPVREYRWADTMNRLEDDAYYSVTVKKWDDQRTGLQNNAFHGPILQALCDYTGYTPLEMKEILIEMFAPIAPVIRPDGTVMERRKRTSEMKVKESTKFINDCIDYAAIEHGIVIEIDPDLRTSGLTPRVPNVPQPDWTDKGQFTK